MGRARKKNQKIFAAEKNSGTVLEKLEGFKTGKGEELQTRYGVEHHNIKEGPPVSGANCEL